MTDLDRLSAAAEQLTDVVSALEKLSDLTMAEWLVSVLDDDQPIHRSGKNPPRLKIVSAIPIC